MSEPKIIPYVHMSKEQALPIIVQVDTIYVHPNIHTIDVTNPDGITRKEYISDEYRYELTIDNVRIATALLCAKYVENSTLNAQISDIKTAVGIEDIDTTTLDGAKKSKIREINNACQQAIFNGTDATTTKGVEHFSMTSNDQADLIAQNLKIVIGGATAVPYHADGQPCRLFSATEFSKIEAECDAYKTKQLSLCNLYHQWINRCMSINDVNKITYGSSLPSDLLVNVNNIINN